MHCHDTPVDSVMKSVMLSVEQNVPPVPEPPQRLAEVGHREPVCVPRGGINVAVEMLNKPQRSLWNIL